MLSFEKFGLSSLIIKALNNMGFEETTPIQERTIPLILERKDVIGQAHTGTGKTAAFGIPMIENFDLDAGQIQGIVLAPTRELAMQVAEELNRIGQFKRIQTLPIYGGQDINRQIRALKKKPHIIVGTPGRLLDHIRRKTLRLDRIKVAILDEADEMLNMGFIEDIESILEQMPEDRQTLLFSATIPVAIQNLAKRFMKNPEIVKIQSKQVTVPNIEQNYIEVKEKQKFDVLCRLLDIQSPGLAIVFGRTKRRVDELYEALNKRGYSSEGIHGDMTQARRDQVMRRFRDGSIEVMVATDVAARGLDIDGVTHIYNFDIPQDSEGYVHRIGRTGRAGKTGIAITFVTPREIPHLKLIEKMTKGEIKRQPVPSMNDAFEGQQRLAVEKLLNTVEEGRINNYKGLAEGLLEETDSVTLLSAALKLLTKEPDRTPVKLTEEAPLAARTKKHNKPYGRRNKYPRGASGKKSASRGSSGYRGKRRKSTSYADSNHSQKYYQ